MATIWRLFGWSVIAIFAALYALALVALLAGTFGLFGQAQDPLAGAFLAPLGSPWSKVIPYAPEALWPWLAAVAPAINLALLWVLLRPGRRTAGEAGTGAR